MPLVERYGDWDVNDDSYDDPHTLTFDHRISASSSDLESVKTEEGLCGVKNNAKATCLITTLDPKYGWIETGEGGWTYNPNQTNLATHFDSNLSACVDEDRQRIADAIAPIPDATTKVQKELKDALEEMSWPADGRDARGMTSFTSRFPLSNEYIAGSEWCSGYHLGNGLVATAGHCLINHLSVRTLPTLKVVFGWFGDVRGKRFQASEVFDIDKVMLCDAPSRYEDATDFDDIASWARGWDSAVFKLKGSPKDFEDLNNVELEARPPKFGTPVYNTGFPLGTPLKISRKAHVLRHAFFDGNKNPFSHGIDICGAYTTDLDQFPGNSGGPVFDGLSGKVVGHTASTQNAVSEATLDAIKNWEEEFLPLSENYQIVGKVVNPRLAAQKPQDSSYRVHPKFHRTLSGSPSGGDMFSNTTFICPNDIGPNGVLQLSEVYQAVFNRHKWDSPDVIHRNLSARIDRIDLFTKPLRSIIQEHPNSTLGITVAGTQSTFKEIDYDSSVIITTETGEWKIPLASPGQELAISPGTVAREFIVDLSGFFDSGTFHASCTSSLADWAALRLQQPIHNPPEFIKLNLVIRRAEFSFPIKPCWPPNRPDITETGKKLEWPTETFHFSTTVGYSRATTQNGDPQPCLMRDMIGGGSVWEAPIDRIWTETRGSNSNAR